MLFYESEFIVHFLLVIWCVLIIQVFFNLLHHNLHFFKDFNKIISAFTFQLNDISQKSLHFASKELFFDFRHKREIIGLFYLLKHSWRHNMFKIHLISHSNIHEALRVLDLNLLLRWFEFHDMISFLQPYIQKPRLLIVQWIAYFIWKNRKFWRENPQSGPQWWFTGKFRRIMRKHRKQVSFRKGRLREVRA